MPEIFSPPLIQAQSWEEAQRKFNEVLRQMARMLNNIYSGANIPTDRIKADAITGAKIADDAVDSEHIVDDAVIAAAVATDAITTTKIADDAITTPKIAAAQVTAAKIAANTITASEIAASTITATELNVSQLDAISANVGTLTAGTITSGITLDSSWRKIYDNTLTADATSVTLSSLTGDTAKHYFISCKWIRKGAGTDNFGIQPNSDTGVSNYGWRTIYSDGNGYSDMTWFMLWMGRADTDGYISQGHGFLQAESGHTRTLIGEMIRNIDPAGKTFTGFYAMGDTWWNTADEITSLKFLCEVATGLKIGTRLEVWERVA